MCAVDSVYTRLQKNICDLRRDDVNAFFRTAVLVLCGFRNLQWLTHYILNKEIVDSRLRPQWCFHLANVTEMQEMLDCKLDALIRSFACEK